MSFWIVQEDLPEHLNWEEFKDLLEENKKRLEEWVLMGEHDKKNIIDPNKQIARNIIIKKNGEIKCYKAEHYLEKLNKDLKPKASDLGTVFTWTHASKRKGISIQLKLPIIIWRKKSLAIYGRI